jgi:Spy/CpxP family protein refolding chaperone
MKPRRYPVAFLALALCLATVSALAQGPPGAPPSTPEDPELREALFRYFEKRLRVDVGLTDEQMAEVVPRVRAMERERARSLRERRATAVELRRAYREGADDAELESLLNRVEEIDREHRSKMAELMRAIDASLTVRQRVEFRSFLQRFRSDVRERVQKLRGESANPRRRRPPAERPDEDSSNPGPP